jgi:hypothetical protein
MGLAKFMMEVIDDADAVITALTTTLMFRRREPGAKP